jgi:hypothetical protein
MAISEMTLEWVEKAEEDAAVAEREGRVRKNPAPGAVCYCRVTLLASEQAGRYRVAAAAWDMQLCT